MFWRHDNPATRSNDGRADPTGRVLDWHNGHCLPSLPMPGRFTAIIVASYCKLLVYRLHDPKRDLLSHQMANTAYFSDTATRQILAVDLDVDGWPMSISAD